MQSAQAEKVEKPIQNKNTDFYNCRDLAIAAQALAFQLDMMKDNQMYKGVFELAALGHGMIYNGPTFGHQLAILKRELQKYAQNEDLIKKLPHI